MRDAMRDAMGHHIMDHRVGHDLMDHRGGVDSLGVPGLALVADLHGGAAIVTVSRVLHILDTTVRKGDLERVNICMCMFYCLCFALT